ncbi:MAG: YdeI/OmpD-associated family protein [Thermomicrobiales bacterium]
MAATKEYPNLPFASASVWEEWLAEHHAAADGVWIMVAKKASGIASVTHDEALDVALCYGWIDGQGKTFDDTYYLQKFTPRRPKSLWSKRNIEKVTALTAAGKMQPAGLAEVEAAKRDGRWDAAYDSPKNMVVPDDFMQALGENEQALAFFNTLNQANKYAIAWRLQTAKKPETRQRRFDALLAMLERGEKLH